MVSLFIIHQIFLLTRDWSKHVTWPNIPQLKLGNIRDQYILKQWIVLKTRADWLVKLRRSCAIYLPAVRERVASRFACLTSEKIIQINFFGVYYLTLLVYTKKTIHLSVGCQLRIFTSPLRGSVNIHRQPPPLR